MVRIQIGYFLLQLFSRLGFEWSKCPAVRSAGRTRQTIENIFTQEILELIFVVFTECNPYTTLCQRYQF
jgi:hypothetical protein